MNFSFIIPALNEEDYIGECIDSIKSQIGDKDEIIIVDNGSEDKTAAISKKLGCRVVEEKKRGISHARNKGSKVAKGEILCFVDADGVLSKNWYKHAKGALSDNEIQAVDGLNIFDHKNLGKKLVYNLYTLLVYAGLLLSKLILKRHYFTGNNMAIRKQVFEKLGGFDPWVDEQIWFSKKFWKLDNNKALLNPQMIIWYSSRRFDKQGYIKTVFYWVKSLFKKESQDEYFKSWKTQL